MTEATGKAKLEISPFIKESPDGHETSVNAVLTNNGSSPLWVNKRFLFNTVYAPKPFREIWFDVTSPTGKKLEFICKVKAGSARQEHYVLLPPGENVKAEVKISRCFDMKEKGKYEIKAHYQDGNSEVPPSPSEALHLKEELVSETIKISIE